MKDGQTIPHKRIRPGTCQSNRSKAMCNLSLRCKSLLWINILTNPLPLLLTILLQSAFSTSFAQPALGLLEFEANGEISWLNGDSNFLPGGGRTSAFFVAVKGEQWSIRLTPINWPERLSPQRSRVPTPLTIEMASDGLNTYRIKRYSPEDLRLSQVAERWSGITPSDRGSDRELYALWYAFASSSYCASMSNHSIVPLEPADAAVYKGIKTQIEIEYPQLPISIVASNQDNGARCEFKVSAFTKQSGLSIPAAGMVGYYLQDGSQWSYTKFVTLNIRPHCSVTSFRLDIADAKALIYDSTYRNSNPPHVLRFETNHWPTSKEVDAKYRSIVTAQRPPAPLGARRSRWPVIILLTVLALGPITFLFYKIKTKKIEKL